MEGKIEDWELIKKKLNAFSKYGLEDWIKSIDPIISEIINTKKGNINISFWKDILFENFEKRPFFPCGPPSPYVILTGWLSKFFPFNNMGEKISKISIYPENNGNPLSEFSTTPIIVVDPNKVEKKFKILSGIIGVSQDPETLCVKPELGFFILDQNWGNLIIGQYNPFNDD